MVPTLFLVVAGLQWSRLNSLNSGTETQKDLSGLQIQEKKDITSLELLRLTPDFGYRNLIANWSFLNFLQYFGNADVRNKIGYRASPEFFEVIIKNDPYFILSYLYLSTSTSLFAGDPDRAVDLMTQGISTMTPETPERGYLVWRYMGIDQLLFLGDGEAARESFATAADWADQSTLPEAESVAQASRQTAHFLEQNPTSKAAQISAWVQIASFAVDNETRRQAVERIESLGGEVLADERGRITVRYRTDE
ncbi:hypothetical protein E1H13_19805 [Nodosilinea sp. P-1105]|nr:hypothetical protein [Nodosilinea sp. P-1105]